MQTPQWAEGLQQVGMYYEGYVDDLDSILDKHKIATLTTYGTRSSHKKRDIKKEKKDVDSAENKENANPIKVCVTHC